MRARLADLRRLSLVLALGLSCLPRPPATPADPDRDGLDAFWEQWFAVDPERADTDGDGVRDGVEAVFMQPADEATLRPDRFEDGSPVVADMFYAAARADTGLWELAVWTPLFFGTEVLGSLGSFNAGGEFGLAFDHHGFLYLARGVNLLRVDPFTGAIAQTIPLHDGAGAGAFVREIAFDPHSLELFGVLRDPASGLGLGRQIVRVDRGSGLVTPIGAPLDAPIRALAFDYDPPFYAEHGSVALAALDTELGSSTLVEIWVDTLSTSQPEISTWQILGFEVAGLAFENRWNWRASATTGLATGTLWRGPIPESYPRALGGMTRPPRCPAPCMREERFLPIDARSYDVRPVDVDGDGDIDLAMNYVDSPVGIAVWRNDGAANFGLASITPSDAVGGLEVADFDGDARLDVAAFGFELWLLAGNGSGGFALPQRIDLDDPQLYAMDAGDVTGDGRVDLVVSDGGELNLIANDGGGAFAAPQTLATGDVFWSLALPGRGDGQRDVAALSPDRLSLLRRNAAGEFDEVFRRTLPSGEFGLGVTAGDLDRSGTEDVIVAVDAPEPYLEIYLDGASGALTPLRRSLPATPIFPDPAVIGDVTGDARPDVLVTTYSGVQILVGDGAGGLTLALPNILLATGYWSDDLALADLDGNGLADPLIHGGPDVWFPVAGPFDPAD